MTNHFKRGLVATALTISGCTSPSPNVEPTAPPTRKSPVISSCHVDDLPAWQLFPPNLNAGIVAESLGGGVTESQVREGVFGRVICDSAISFEQVSQRTSVVSVRGLGQLGLAEGQGDRCLAMFIASESAPAPGQSYTMFGVVCPAPNGTI